MQPTAHICAGCGGDFEGVRNAKFCSRRCRDRIRRQTEAYREASRTRARENYAPRNSVAFLNCEACGSLFAARVRTAKFCRDVDCRLARLAIKMAAKREADPTYGRAGYTAAAAASYHRRRALKKGATVENFTPDEVYERDGWTCGLCSEPVDSHLKWPDPMSVSLDHVIPLSRGGEHSRANTQCAHLSCNVRKGAQVA